MHIIVFNGSLLFFVPLSSIHCSHHAPDQLHHEQLHTVMAATRTAQWHHPWLWAAILWKGKIVLCVKRIYGYASFKARDMFLGSDRAKIQDFLDFLWSQSPGMIMCSSLCSFPLSHRSLVSGTAEVNRLTSGPNRLCTVQQTVLLWKCFASGGVTSTCLLVHNTSGLLSRHP